MAAAAADSDDVTRGDLISYSNKDDVQSGPLKSPKTKGKNFFALVILVHTTAI